MKKCGIIFFMSYLLSFAPTVFGAHKDFHDRAISVMREEYYYREQGTICFKQLSNMHESETDHFDKALDVIQKQALINKKKEADRTQGTDQQPKLPMFTLDTRDKLNTVKILDTETGRPLGDYFSPILYSMASDEKTINLFDEKQTKIATINILKNSYDPNTPSTEPEKQKLIINDEQKENSTEEDSTELPKKSSSFTLPKIAFAGTVVAILASVLWYNKDLASSSMEAIFTRISNSCQGMLSRISSHTNNLRA